jgi:hypothetical protein
MVGKEKNSVLDRQEKVGLNGYRTKEGGGLVIAKPLAGQRS